MKIKLKKNISLLFFSLLSFSLVFAQTTSKDLERIELKEAINKITNALLGIVGLVAVVVLIIGGFQYITSTGNPDQIGKAKNTIMYAIIGLVVVILSYAIVKFVVNSFL